MNIEQAKILFNRIDESSLTALKNDLYSSAVRYAGLRAEWYLSSTEEKNAMDAERTAAHNAFIDACNILSRNMIKSGEDASWRKQLGDDRKVIGDFASYLHLIFCLTAR